MTHKSDWNEQNYWTLEIFYAVAMTKKVQHLQTHGANLFILYVASHHIPDITSSIIWKQKTYYWHIVQSGHLCDYMEVSVIMHSHGNDIFWENC